MRHFPWDQHYNKECCLQACSSSYPALTSSFELTYALCHSTFLLKRSAFKKHSNAYCLTYQFHINFFVNCKFSHKMSYNEGQDLVVEYRTRNRKVAGSTHTRSTASNLEQVANLLCAQANSASYPSTLSLRLRGEGLVWLIGATVCLLAAPWVQLSVSAGNGWPHNGLRHHWLMPISCHFRDCKALLVTSLTHVSRAIASAQNFTFIVHSLAGTRNNQLTTSPTTKP